MDWSGCPLVVSRRAFVSGAPALRDDPRVTAASIIDNMDDGMTADEVANLFALTTPVTDVAAIYNYARATSP